MLEWRWSAIWTFKYQDILSLLSKFPHVNLLINWYNVQSHPKLLLSVAYSACCRLQINMTVILFIVFITLNINCWSWLQKYHYVKHNSYILYCISWSLENTSLSTGQFQDTSVKNSTFWNITGSKEFWIRLLTACLQINTCNVLLLLVGVSQRELSGHIKAIMKMCNIFTCQLEKLADYQVSCRHRCCSNQTQSWSSRQRNVIKDIHRILPLLPLKIFFCRCPTCRKVCHSSVGLVSHTRTHAPWRENRQLYLKRWSTMPMMARRFCTVLSVG